VSPYIIRFSREFIAASWPGGVKVNGSPQLLGNCIGVDICKMPPYFLLTVGVVAVAVDVDDAVIVGVVAVVVLVAVVVALSPQPVIRNAITNKMTSVRYNFFNLCLLKYSIYKRGIYWSL
jgi:hypothetical protein